MTEKIILLVGRTGGGKSTLANVLSGIENASAESENSASKTKEIKKVNFGHEGKEYQIVDSIGIGDTTLTEGEVLSIIVKGYEGIKEKEIQQVLFVVGERLTPEEVNTFNMLKEVFFDNSFHRYATIVRTRFPSFEDENECEKDRKLLLEEGNPAITNMMKSNNGFIHIDNPSINIIGSGKRIERQIKLNKEIREESRKKLLKHLQENCQESYKLESWDKIENKFKTKLKEENKKFEAEIKNLKENMKKEKNNSELKELKEKLEKLEQKIKDNKKLIEKKLINQLIEVGKCQIL